MVLGIACTSLAVLLLPLVAARAPRAPSVALGGAGGVGCSWAVPATRDYASA